jgi:hypothetical protein
VKCTFDLLKKRFNILAILDQPYSQRTFRSIICVCVILYNMIIDDERDDNYNKNYYTVTYIVAPPVTYEASTSLTSIL